jgi:hypothetical protein
MAMLKITEEMREAAGKLLKNRALKFDRYDRDLLAAISDGKRKLIQAHWWVKFFKKIDQIKLDKLQRLADPARNPNVHERAVASRKLAEFKASRAPGMPPPPPPLPEFLTPRYQRYQRKWKWQAAAPASVDGVNTKAETAHGGVNKKAETAHGGVNKKPKRTGDRHRNKGDRHKPGYMRDYMRRRRANLRREH